MKLFLKFHDGDPPFAEWREPDRSDDPGPSAHSGLHRWADSVYHRWLDRWHSAHSGMTGALHHFWDWLNRATPRDEPMLTRLRTAASVEFLVGPGLDPDQIRSRWDSYLTERRRRHRVWFALNLLISPLTVLLAPLPGPNVIGYWFAYRAVHHWLILRGIRRARNGDIRVDFRTADRSAGVNGTGNHEREPKASAGDSPSERPALLDRESASERQAGGLG